jgi:3-isopropylmalate/(R)-2-methylmalate dehydratase small subunit
VKPVIRVVGRALPLDRANVDTDQIIPAHWLKRIERTGYKDGLFEAWRKDPEFVLNDQRFRGASILIAGANFGSGSSREHAVWALQENGFEAVIAPSFADIFRNNAVKCGLLTAQLPADVVTRLLRAVEAEPSILIVIDVAERTVMAPAITAQFPLDDHTRHRLLEGLDDIDVTMRHEKEITAFEARRPDWLPRVRA